MLLESIMAIITGICIISTAKGMPKLKNESSMAEYCLGSFLIIVGILGLISLICGR